VAIIVQLLYKLEKQGANKSAVKRACIQEKKKITTTGKRLTYLRS